MNLQEIQWPVFRLGEHKPIMENGIVYYSKEYVDTTTNQTKIGLRVVDDKNVDGKTLGIRRLHLRMEGAPLFSIRAAIYFLVDVIKLAKQTTWFIDNCGMVFQYKKSTRAKLQTFKIKNIVPLDTMGAIIEVEGLTQRFKCIFKPKPEQTYAGVLRWGLGYILYGFYENPIKPTYRRV